jgi:hypothetical protein
MMLLGVEQGLDTMKGTPKGGGARGEALRLTAILRAERGSCQTEELMVLGAGVRREIREQAERRCNVLGEKGVYDGWLGVLLSEIVDGLR